MAAEERIEKTLSAFDPSLRSELLKSRVLEPADFYKPVFETFYRDLKTNLLDSAVRFELRRRGIIPIAHHLEIEQREDDEFAVGNDLSYKYRLPTAAAHRIIDNAMMALGGLDERIGGMQTYSALMGLGEKDKALLDAKVGVTVAFVAPKTSESEFSRVIALKGLPVPEYGSTVLNVKALLKLRESDECRAFKQWLSGSEVLSDKELKERVSGFSKRIRQALHSKTGKALRFVVSNGLAIGLGFASPLVGIPAGIAVSAIDSFLLDRLIPRDAVLSFLSESYPSLFQARAER